jgi:8-oxo-dGTP pyrophosphatase MutT (NUDIX family)
MVLRKSNRPKSKTKVVSVAAFNEDGQLLFGLRQDNNSWNLPGGHLNPDEEPQEGALRELLEETGLEGKSLSYLGQADVGKVVVYSFVCEVSGNPSGDEDPDLECSTWRFVEPDDIPEEIMSNLHNKQDVTLGFLGIQKNLAKSDWEASSKTIPVQHFSDARGLTTLDPKFQGTGNPGAERNRSNRIPRIYLYARPGKTEGGVEDSRYLYHGELPIGTKLYDFGEDKLRLLQPKWIQTNKGREYREADLDKAEKKLRANGYHGYHNYGVKDSIAYFHPLDVTQIDSIKKAELQKGLLSTGILAAHLMGGGMQTPKETPSLPKVEQTAPWKPESLSPEMLPIAQLESSMGQNMKHAPSKAGDFDTAFGALGLKPQTAHHEWNSSKFMQKLYPGLNNPEDFVKKFKSDHKFYNLLGSAHFARLKARHGSVQSAVYAWRHGTGAAANATPEQIAAEPYVQKFTHMSLRQAEGRPLVEPPAPQPLTKSIDPKDFAPHLKESDQAGRDLVDHKPDLEAHPPEMNDEVKHYRDNVLGSPKVFKKKKGKVGGVSKKTVYQVKPEPQMYHEGKVIGKRDESSYLVKPYNEKIVKRLKKWQRHPHQGWSEMTSQALFHAAGVGHLHQQVHVSEHEMEDPKTGEKRKEPALVVHLAKGFKPAADAFDIEDNLETLPPERQGNPVLGGGTHVKNGTRKVDYKSNNPDDIRKVAIMDFLANNLDRHSGNLMLHKDGRVLAVDHSRSFQYTNTHKSKWGRTRREIDKWARSNTPCYDKFWDYVKDSALSQYEPEKPKFGNPNYNQQMKLMEAYEPLVEQWWPKHRDNIVKTMTDRLSQIKDPKIVAHIKRNFLERVKWFDDRARDGLSNYGADGIYSDMVNWYPVGQETDEEREEKANR